MKTLPQGQNFLKKHGLNLFAVLDCHTLPSETAAVFTQAAIPLNDYKRLVLIGNGGRAFWEALQTSGIQTADPVDDFSEQITRQFVQNYLPSTAELFWLFPAPHLVPLQQLGQLAGWSHPSPLGLGINHEFGVWFAYRAAFLTTAELPLTTTKHHPSPCDSCAEKPCISHCPAAAVRGLNQFDVPACATYRLAPQSPCTDRCLSRLACPIAPQHRYSLAQIQYHYRHSLTTLADWFDSSNN